MKLISYSYLHILFMVGCVLLNACGGETTFRGSDGGYVPAPGLAHRDAAEAAQTSNSNAAEHGDDSDETVLERQTNESLEIPGENGTYLWGWGCGGDIPSENPNDVILSGSGVHRLHKSTDAIPLKVSWQLCDPRSKERHITLIIDVSSSMATRFGTGTDPFVNGSCGRFKLAQKVFQGMKKDGTAQISLITFHDSIHMKTDGFLAPSEFQSRFLKPEILCYGAEETNYTKPLEQAIKFYRGDLDNISKEVYFISDGKPNPETANGINAARDLKQKYGVTIVTMMLKGDDEILKKYIASKDANGNVLHTKVDHADEMVDSLRQLTEYPLVGGYIRYRIPGDADWTQQNILELAEQNIFTWEGFSLSYDNFPLGIEFDVNYWDGLERHYGGSGKIEWIE